LAVSEFCHIFVAVNELAISYQSNRKLQKNISFLATFNALYLVVPNNLLTHTHTHTFALSVV